MTIPSNCIYQGKRDHVVLEDAGQKLIIRFEKAEKYTKIHLDGCVFSQEETCDFLVEYKGLDILVELKGKDVIKAFNQISTSREKIKSIGYGMSKVIGIVSATRIPFRSTVVDSYRERFLRQKGILLYVTSSNRNSHINGTVCRFR